MSDIAYISPDPPSYLSLKIEGIYAWCRSVERYTGRLLKPVEEDRVFVGVDPGQRNSGLCILEDDRYTAYQIVWDEFPDRVQGLHYIFNLIRTLATTANSRTGFSMYTRAVVEDAAYAASHGQVPLGEMRAAAALALFDRGYKTYMKAPPSVYKLLFGHGRRASHEVWKGLLPRDAASALGCAILAAHWMKFTGGKE